MEPAKIDWKKIDSRFVEDVFYEHIKAPKWFDFLAAADDDSVDDGAWFCRPDCNHPKTAEDFLKTPPNAKLRSPINVNEILPLRDQNERDTKLKRRGQTAVPSATNDDLAKYIEDSENQNPNLSAPSNHQAKSWKAAFKSSSVKKKNTDEQLQNKETPKLKSTLSARNLFAGRDILGHITEFCYELKKLATRARERENEEKSDEGKIQLGKKNEGSCDVFSELEGKETERKPLHEMGKEKCEETDKGNSAKEKHKREKRVDDAENIPLSLNLENVKHKGEERRLQIRTNPPSPQCFSVTRAPAKTTPSKTSRSKPMERGILQELALKREVQNEEQPADKTRGSISSIVEAKEQRAFDVLWFLKPCTLAN